MGFQEKNSLQLNYLSLLDLDHFKALTISIQNFLFSIINKQLSQYYPSFSFFS